MSENHWFDDLQDEDFLSWASTFEEVEESGCDTALFCIGAIEQHSYHMPLGTDWLLGLSGSRLLARELAERGLKVYLLPPIPIGTSSEFLNYKGTLSSQAQYRWRQFCEDIALPASSARASSA